MTVRRLLHPRQAAAPALALLLAAAPTAALAGADTLGDVRSIVASEAHRLLGAGAASVSVVIVQGAEITWEAAFGHSNVWAGLPATPETIYNAASTFKPVTAATVLQLAEAGALLLDDSVEQHLSGVLPSGTGDPQNPIRVFHLLSHSSGLSSPYEFVPLWDHALPRTLPQVVAAMERRSAPGEMFEYNNAAYALAALLVEEVASVPFQTFIRNGILDPLGVETPDPFRPTPAMVERMALPYEPEGGAPRAVDFARTDVYPAGDVWLTARDMGLVLCALLNGGACGERRILSDASVARMAEPVLIDYGLGLGVLQESPTRVVGHGGGVPGYTSFFMGDLDLHVGVYAMANSGDLSRLAQATLATLQGREWLAPESRPVVDVPVEILEDYVGTYEVQAGVEVVVLVRDGQLLLQGPGEAPVALLAQSASTFFFRESLGTITFVRDASGKVVALDSQPGGEAKKVR